MRPPVLNPLFAALTSLSGIGPKLEALYARLLDRETPRLIDLLFHLPSGTIDRRARPKLNEVEPGTVVTVAVTVEEHRPAPRNRPRAPYRILVSDDTGTTPDRPDDGAALTPGEPSAVAGQEIPAAAEVIPPPPPDIQDIITDVAALLQGEARDLTSVPLDMDDLTDFDRRVYEVARGIPPGRVLTYGEIASRLGIDNARAVGQSLGRNPFAVIVPCHRVVAANGRLGGFSANGGATTKRRLLAIEGARRDESPTLFDLIP